MVVFHVKEVGIVLKYKTQIAILVRKVAGFSEKGATFLQETRLQNHKYTIVLVMI